MREILFRGKTPSQDEHFDDGEWVQGFYACFNGKEHRIYSGNAETDCGDYYPDWCNVRPETVGQYTGLTDKNGTKIFEGDIVKDSFLLGKVVYATSQDGFDGIAGFMVDDVLDGLQNYNGFWHQVEVIGNIHDNPESLKGEEENA